MVLANESPNPKPTPQPPRGGEGGEASHSRQTTTGITPASLFIVGQCRADDVPGYPAAAELNASVCLHGTGEPGTHASPTVCSRARAVTVSSVRIRYSLSLAPQSFFPRASRTRWKPSLAPAALGRALCIGASLPGARSSICSI